MFSTDIIFQQQENFTDNQKCLAGTGFRPLCNKILLSSCPIKGHLRAKSVKNVLYDKK